MTKEPTIEEALEKFLAVVSSHARKESQKEVEELRAEVKELRKENENGLVKKYFNFINK